MPNDPPTAIAGPNQSVDEGAMVQLAGQGADPEGGALSFVWSQVSGPAVVFSSISDPAATFSAPEVPIRNTDPVVLSLRVTDARGASDNDEISIAVASTDFGVFIANKENISVDELYRYDAETDAVSKLSGPLIAGGDVSHFSISPDGQWVAYRADQDTDNISELYIAAADSSGVSKVNGALPVNGDVHTDFVWSPDSANIAFTTDADEPAAQDVFVVDPLGRNLRRIASTFRWAPDSSLISYIADQDTENVFELYLSTPDGVMNTNISEPLVPGGDALEFSWSP